MNTDNTSSEPLPMQIEVKKEGMTKAKVSGTIRSKNPLKGAVAVIENRLYYAALKAPPPSHNILASTPRRSKDAAKTEKKQIHFFNIDNELVYWNFFLDFGPLNLGQLTRFCQRLNDKLQKFPVVCFYSNTVPAKRCNAIFLICAWQLLFLDRSPEEAFRGFDEELLATEESGSASPVSHSAGAPTVAPLPPFHDASPCACNYQLTVLDCLRGMAKARSCGFFDLRSFDVEEYEHFEQVENGDLNWIVKDKILAFAGPSFERHVSPEGYCTLAPADYIPYFQRKNVGLVVRLNKKAYHEQDFIDAGIQHLEAFFLDGSCPPMDILERVVEAFEAVPREKAFAVHCKAGLGRTGTCIGAYLMKHYRFSAAEVIGWMRICRPGMVIGPQQHFLKQIERTMWQAGASAKISRHIVGMSNRHLLLNSQQHPNSEEEDEAVTGRAGQAEQLLAARGRRAHGQHPIPSTPQTPEQSLSSKQPAVVTPNQGSSPKLFFN